MKIAIVNHNIKELSLLRQIIQEIPSHQLAWTAQNGSEAIYKCQKNTPDLVLMDLQMPIMDGVEATAHIMKHCPCAILIVAKDIQNHISQVYTAMGYGALDVAEVPVIESKNYCQITDKLVAKITRINTLVKNKNHKNPQESKKHNLPLTSPQLVVIGSSTGGPKALANILSKLPHDFSAAIAIVQHVDQTFSHSFIEWLNQQTPLPVKLALSGDRLQKSTVLVAGTNNHLYLKPNLTLAYTKHPLNYPYRPSVDVFFNSVAEHWKNPGIAILLTGMGKDGAEGLNTLKLKGWHTIAQNKTSSVVYGMPKAAVDLNAAVEILSLYQISNNLLKTFVISSSKS